MVIDDKFYLNLAIDEAWKYQILTYPNPAVGCAIVSQSGELLAVCSHKKAGYAHAELRATKKALKKLNPKLKLPKEPHKLHDFILKNHLHLLKDSTYYVTLEPCSHSGKTPSCAVLLKNLGVKKVFIGYKDINKKASGGAKMLKKAGIDVHWAKSELKQRCYELLEPFLMWQKDGFSFYKLAMGLNGVVDGGIISSKKSRILVHKLRDRCELLSIGGNTVRIDRPKLDARYCKGKAPDVFIYSRKQKFDKTIPLFNVKSRKVFIGDSFTQLKDYKLTMIEGGEGMLRALPKEVKHLLLFQSPNFLEGKNIEASLHLKLLWQGKIGKDRYGWYKRK